MGNKVDENLNIYEVDGVITSLPILIDSDAKQFEILMTRAVQRPSQVFIQHQIIRFDHDYYKDVVALLGKAVNFITDRVYDESTGFSYLNLMEYEELAVA